MPQVKTICDKQMKKIIDFFTNEKIEKRIFCRQSGHIFI